MKNNVFDSEKEDSKFVSRNTCYNARLIFTMLMSLIIFASGCKAKDDTLATALNETRNTCIALISSSPIEKWNINNIEYNLGEEWRYEFNEEKISVLYNKSFFFLLQKDSIFSNSANSKVRKHIKTIYSCSGVPPHLTTIERTYFSVDPNNMVEVEKTEVLEGGKLVVAPTDEDTFFDVLQKQDAYDKKAHKNK
jgi:hypothetical protein